MLFIFTLLAFGTCLAVVYAADSARVSMQTRRRRADETMLGSPSGQPAPVPARVSAPQG